VPSNNNGATRKSKSKKNLLKPKSCPNCDESNKPENKFCVKCKFVLSFDAFSEAIEEKAKAAKEAEQQKIEIAAINARTSAVEEQLRALADALAVQRELSILLSRVVIT
jgi:hypothetical protein